MDAPRKRFAEGRGPFKRPPLRLMATTLWEYPSQHYNDSIGRAMQGDKEYIGATPSWVIWQVLQRYTREGDVVVDPMCGSGTTIDVCADLEDKRWPSILRRRGLTSNRTMRADCP